MFDSRRTFPWIVAILSLGCGGPRPSQEPLGWGPLPKPTSSARAPSPPKPGPAEASSATADERVAASDSGDAGQAESHETPPAPKPEPATPKPEASETHVKVATLAGSYGGEDVATYHLEGVPDRTERDPNAKITVKVAGEHELDFVLIDSSNGNDICTLRATVSDASAAVTSGQGCFEQSGEGVSASATVTQGTGTFDGTRLVLQLSLDFEMQLGDRATAGTLEYRFEGTRR
jgi:hypothetical protein